MCSIAGIFFIVSVHAMGKNNNLESGKSFLRELVFIFLNDEFRSFQHEESETSVSGDC